MKVYDVIAYDKSTKNSSFHTHIAVGALRTDDRIYLNKELKEYGLTDDDIQFYFKQDEFSDGQKFKDTKEFFYVIGRETQRITVKAKRKKEKMCVFNPCLRTWSTGDETPFNVEFVDTWAYRQSQNS